MKRITVTITSVIIALFFLGNEAFAKITVVSVKGRVSYKSRGKWKPLIKGMKLREGTKISTGVRSRAVIRLNDHTLRIRPLSMIKIYQNRTRKGVSRTRIGMRRGSLRAKIKRGRKIRTVFRVSTPVATSSVRGTEPDYSFGPGRGFRITLISGDIEAENRNGSKKKIKGNQSYNQRNDRSQSDDILGDTKNNSFVTVYDNNVTESEADSFGTSSDFTSDADNGAVASVDDVLLETKRKATVNINIVFP